MSYTGPLDHKFIKSLNAELSEDKVRERVNKILDEQKEAQKPPSSLEAAARKAQGDRYNDGKLKWSYVHFKSLEPMVRVLMFGARKYAPFNWQKGLQKAEILESMQRHLAAIIDGEILDKESGLPHMGHIQCNAMFYNYMIEQEKIPDVNHPKSDIS